MERERRRREKVFLFFYFFIFSCFFFFVPVYLSSFFFEAHLPSDLYWLGKIQPTYSQTLPAAAQCCQSFILYFPLRLASSFSWRARRHIRSKRRRRRSGSIGLLKERDERGKQRKKVVSSPQEKIWKYFCINKYLLTLKKNPEREKRETAQFTRL